MAGLKVVTVQCDAKGNVDVADLAAKAKQLGPNVAALMVYIHIPISSHVSLFLSVCVTVSLCLLFFTFVYLLRW